MLISRKRQRVVRAVDDEETDDVSEVHNIGNCVYFYAPVTSGNVLKLITCLRNANECASRVPHVESRVYLYIHSGGGDAYAGLSAMDHIRSNPVAVTAIVDGMVASAASFILLGADDRRCMPHSFVRIHQVSISGFEGKYVDFVDELENTNSLMDVVRDVYMKNTSLTRKRLDEILKKEIDMNAQTCIKEGIVQCLM